MNDEKNQTVPGSTEAVVRAPGWLLQQENVNNREWKAMKRKQVKIIKQAFDVYRTGCAYCPGYGDEFVQFEILLNRIIKLHSVKEWGR